MHTAIANPENPKSYLDDILKKLILKSVSNDSRIIVNFPRNMGKTLMRKGLEKELKRVKKLQI